MDRDKAKEIARRYPETIKVYPRDEFINQLTDFIIKEFKDD
jgi:hypothetical protein